MNDAIDLVGSDTRLHCFRTNGKDLCCKLNKGVRCEEKNNNKEEQQRRKEISYTSSNSRLLDLFRGVLHDLRRLPELLLGVTLTGQRECIVGSWNVRWHLQRDENNEKNYTTNTTTSMLSNETYRTQWRDDSWTKFAGELES